jgi:large subunit ribosomal protein L31
MKTGIHPKVHKKITATCGCGASFVFDSTAEVIKTEICSACHPFYTGKQKLLDTAGKVDKFRARMAAAKSATASKKKGKISENVKAAAAAASASRDSAVDSAKVVKKVQTAVQKREIKKAKLEEDLKSKKDSEKVEAENSEPVEKKEE